MASGSPKIVIVGGSVTGLTLATLLERLGIDYVLLEAYENLAPQLGAGLALWTNGLRILDQLGYYDEFCKDAKPATHVYIRVDGKPARDYEGFSDQYEKRHGYGMIFNDRKTLLDILYNNLKDKSKVLTKKRVVRVETLKSGVRAHTQDGDSFTGDMLIGADGVHSSIREEMWRLASETSPGYFPAEGLKNSPITFRAIFAISKPNPRFPEGKIHTSAHKGFSYLAATGPQGRLYWFLFEQLDKPYTHSTVPRYTQDDVKAMVEAHKDDIIYNDLTTGELYDTRLHAAITPLHEFMCDRWHFQRILTLGDAAHKLNPLTGQGGNNAIEDVAAFVNVLTRTLDAAPGAALSDDQVSAIFAETQAVRKGRAQLSLNLSHKAAKLDVLDVTGGGSFFRALLKILPRDARLERWTSIVVNSIRVDKLPVPARPHFTPFPSDLPAAPLRNVRWPRWAAAAALAGLYYLGRKTLLVPKFPAVPEFLGQPGRTVYTGNAGIDAVLSIMVMFFAPAVAGGDPASRLQVLYFLTTLVPTVAIWTLEGRRRGNNQTLLGLLVRWPTLFAAMYQIQGIGKIAPLYYLISLFTSNHKFYKRTTGRPVDPAVAKALLPAVAVGFLVPSVLMFSPFQDRSVWQGCIAAWQVAPLLVSPLTTLFASAIRRLEGRRPADPSDKKELDNSDVPHLLSTYSSAVWLTGTAHVASLAYVALSPGLSLSSVFFNLRNPFGPLSGLSLGEAITSFFKYDFIGYAGSVLVWSLYSVFEMRRLGYVTTAEATRAAVGVVGSLPLLGPGAMYAGTWHWREQAIARVSKW